MRTVSKFLFFSGFGSFEQFVADTFIDGQFGDDFLSELLSAKFVFQNYRKFIKDLPSS